MDVGADQDSRDDVADDDRDPHAGCERGSDEADAGDHADIEHDGGCLNHVARFPGGPSAVARDLRERTEVPIPMAASNLFLQKAVVNARRTRKLSVPPDVRDEVYYTSEGSAHDGRRLALLAGRRRLTKTRRLPPRSEFPGRGASAGSVRGE